METDLIVITPEQVTSGILALFDITRPTMPRAFNVLEGINRGEILVDDPRRPATAVVRDGMYGTLYFGGSLSTPLITALVQSFRGTGEVGIGCWLDDPINTMLPTDFHYDGRTYFFTGRSLDGNSARDQLPSGYSLMLRDRELFHRSFDYQSTLELFGTVEDVLENTFGVMIMQGDALVCEAATGAPTQGRIEVGVTTAEAYRRQGFATIACTRLIEICEAHGYKTWWDCAKENVPSVKLARRLGFQGEPEYRYVWWPKIVT